MRTLVRLPNWVGDTIMALPCLEALSRAWGDELLLVGRDLPLQLTDHISPGSPRVVLRRGRRCVGAVRAIRALGADQALLLTPSLSSALMIWAAGVRRRIGWKEQGRQAFLTEPVTRPPRGARHLTAEFEELARRAGGEIFAPVPLLPPDAGAAAEAEDLLPSGSGRWVALCPGVQYGTAKRWPPERFRRLREVLESGGWGGWVIGGPADRQVGEEVLAGAGAAWRNAAGTGNIRVSAELLRRARVAVTNDTGSMHLAAAVGTRVVALFGPTDPAWTGPLGENHAILFKECPCRPCFRRHCPEGDPAPCMAALSVERVAEVVEGRAIFLDRDGTLCKLVPYLSDPAQLELIPGAGEALRAARAAGYRLVVVTNQSGIARGLFTRADVDRLHEKLQRLLEPYRARIDRFYICPHHPDHTGPCDCRKPAPGMLLKAVADLGLDPARCTMIGDTREDIEAGLAAGCRAMLVRTGYGGEETSLPPETRSADDLPSAIAAILSDEG